MLQMMVPLLGSALQILLTVLGSGNATNSPGTAGAGAAAGGGVLGGTAGAGTAAGGTAGSGEILKMITPIFGAILQIIMTALDGGNATNSPDSAVSSAGTDKTGDTGNTGTGNTGNTGTGNTGTDAAQKPKAGGGGY